MPAEPKDKVRVDKWLWSVRIFKSRSIASEVVRQGHVKADGKTLKPSSLVTAGDLLRVRRNGYDMRYRVLRTIEKRVGAPIAVECYADETPAKEMRKFDDWRASGAGAPVGLREKGTGRPTKRERRDIDEFRDSGGDYDWGWVDEAEGGV